jgi:hypothetical protein
MANQVTIYTISGLTTPFSGYCCDVYGNQCSYIGIISSLPTTITLPIQFNTAPAIGLKLIKDNGCEIIETINCTT